MMPSATNFADASSIGCKTHPYARLSITFALIAIGCVPRRLVPVAGSSLGSPTRFVVLN